VKNEEVLLRVGGKEYPTYNIRIGHILYRICLLKLVSEGRIERTGRRERRCKPLLDDLQERHWNLNSVQQRLWSCRKIGYEMNE